MASAPPEAVERLDLVVHSVEHAGDGTPVEEALRDALLLAGRVLPLLEAGSTGHRGGFVTLSRLDGRLGLSGSVPAERAPLGGVTGLVKTLAVEAPDLFARAVDLAPEITVDRAVGLLLGELHDTEHSLTQVGHDGHGERVTVGLTERVGHGLPSPVEVPAPSKDDLLIVTGGARGVTAACAVGVAERYGCGMLLLGRTPLEDEPSWAEGVPEEELRARTVQELRKEGLRPLPKEVGRIADTLAAQREIRDTLDRVRATGARAEYIAVDINDAEAVEEALAPHAEEITGLVHGAGVLADGLIVDKRPQDVERVLATKLTGLTNVLEAVPTKRLSRVLLFSSVAGFFGNRGQSDYAMANEALNRLACSLHGGATRVTSINWGAWAGGMVTPALEQMFAERGVTLIPLAEGVRYFVEQFTRDEDAPVCVVGPTTPLSAPESTRPRKSEVVLERELAPLSSSPVLTDHSIGGSPVLPATAAIGAALNAVHRTLPAEWNGVRDFSVHKGVRFDEGSPSLLRMLLRPEEGRSAVRVGISDGEGRPRYGATVLAEGSPPPARLTGLPSPEGGEPVSCYEDGTLFHGPSLRGLTRLLDPGERLVLACRLPDTELGDGAWRAPGYSPVLSDLLLQAVLVWARVHRDEAVLPTAVGEVRLVTDLPDDEPFLVVVDEVSTTTSGLKCNVLAWSPGGRGLQRLREVQAVPSPGLGAKFVTD